MANDPSEVRRVLEGLRQRFAQLAESTLKLRHVIDGGGDGLSIPDQSTLLASYTVVATHQQAVTEHLARHHDLLAALQVYPLPSYPGQTEEAMLLQLLRKKPEPRVEDWLETARETFLKHTRCDGEGEGEGKGKGKEGGNVEARMGERDWLDLWNWAPEVVRGKVLEYRRAKLGDQVGDEDGDGDGDDGDDGDDGEDGNGQGDLQLPGAVKVGSGSNVTGAAAAAAAAAAGTAATKGGQDVEMKDAEEPTEPVSLSRMLRFLHTGTMPPPEPTRPRQIARPPGR